MLLDLDAVLDAPLDGTVKGIPGDVEPFPLRDVAARGWNVLAGDLPLPLLVLKRSALEHNLDLMARYCATNDVLIAPHGKTTMAPQLFAAQLEHGAWGITVASVQQTQVCRTFGVTRIVIANEVYGAQELGYLASELRRDPDLELYLWVDSVEGVAALADAAREHRLERPWQVLLEVGSRGGRTGVRDEEAVRAVTDAVARSDGRVELVGVSCYEGLLDARRIADGSAAAVRGDIDGFLDQVVTTAARLRDAGHLPADHLLSGGGSTSFGAVVREFRAAPPPVRVLLRSCCYVTHDHGMYAALSPLDEHAATTEPVSFGSLQPALELWTHVNSAPEPGLALLTGGRRDVPYDAGLPVPLALVAAGTRERQPLDGASVFGVNDQHAYLRHEEHALRVGDRVVLGISHPCTAFDKWRVILVVDDEHTVVDAIRTYF